MDRPALTEDEIEITPEMLDAASEVLERGYFGDGNYDVSGDVMAKVYRAMRKLECR